MYRLFFLMIAFIFGYMLWRIVRVVMRSGVRPPGEDGPSGRASGRPSTPVQSFKDVKDAEFEDLNPPRPSRPAGPQS